MSAAAKPPGARQKQVSGSKQVRAEGRKDPRPRPIGGSVQFNLVGHDPERYHYVGVFRGDDDAWMNYSLKGYEQVEYRGADGPRVRGARTCEMGQPLEYKGHVVMALPREEYDAQQQAAFDRGRLLQQHMQGKIAARREVGDNPLFPVVNETTDLYEETL